MKKKLTELMQYSGKFIALSPQEEVIASDTTIKKLEKKLKPQDAGDITIRYIAPIDKFLSPVCL